MNSCCDVAERQLVFFHDLHDVVPDFRERQFNNGGVYDTGRLVFKKRQNAAPPRSTDNIVPLSSFPWRTHSLVSEKQADRSHFLCSLHGPFIFLTGVCRLHCNPLMHDYKSPPTSDGFARL